MKCDLLLSPRKFFVICHGGRKLIVWNPSIQAYELRGGGAKPRRMRSFVQSSGSLSHHPRAPGRRGARPFILLTRPAPSKGQGIYSFITMPVSRYWIVVVMLVAQVVMLVGVL